MRWLQNCLPLLLMFLACILVSLFGPGVERRRAWNVFTSNVVRLADNQPSDAPRRPAPPEHTAASSTRTAPLKSPAPSARPRAATRAAPAPATTTPRKRITPFQARLVAAKYGFRCAICGDILDAGWETDHIVPLSRGGTNDLSNLQPVHRVPCHQMKSSREATAGEGGRRYVKRP